MAADLDQCRTKLGNSKFISNAPEEIVAKERRRTDELTQKLEQLDAQLEQLSAAR